MRSITFDKLVYMETLKKSGVSEKQARAQAEALDIALRDSVATRADVRELETRLKVWTMGQVTVIIGLMIAFRFFD